MVQATAAPLTVQATTGGMCMVERYNLTKPASVDSLNCTSNDVQIARFINLSQSVTECVEGETVTIPIEAEVVATSAERWDIGLFIALDGKNPNILNTSPGGSQDCFDDYLHPVSTTNLDLDVDGGTGPYYNGELGVQAKDGTYDQCGDVQQGVHNFHDVNGGTALTFVCQDPDNDGYADIPACTVWANSASTKTDDTSCQSELDITAETTAKCTCEAVKINLVVRKAGTITVKKVLSPSTDGGKFDLQIDGVSKATDVGNNGTTGAVIVDAGLVPPGTGASHSVGEIAGTGTDLGNYNSSISCTSDQDHSASGSGTGPLSMTVLPEEHWICTITNTLKPAHLTLVKVVTNDNGGTAANTAWTLSATGPTTISGTSGSAAVTSAEVPSGIYALAETGGPSGYSAGSWGCVGGVLNGSNVTLSPGGSATCTITNNDVAPSLTLVKVVTNDNGGTATAADWTLSATGPVTISGAGGTTSGAGFKAGKYTLSEGIGPSGYVGGVWTCIGGTQDGASVTLALAESAVCTIVNDDIAPSLTLVKHVVNDNGGTAVATDFTLSATGATTISGAGGVTSDATFSAGKYTLGETGPSSYSAGSWLCTGGTQDAATITLAVGESATCEITNDDKPPYLKIVKKVSNVHGGTAVATDWTLSATGTTTISGAGGAESGPTFVAGAYALAESAGPSGYAAGTWSCVGGTLVASSVTVGVGESATCEITNTDQPGHITVLKTVAGAAPTGDQSFTFQLRSGASSTTVGTTLESKIITALNGGSAVAFTTGLDANTTYQLCEIVMPGWLSSLGSFVPGSFYPPDGVAPNPTVDNSILCVDFTLGSGETKAFTVDNTPPPGGRALTIGFWKNWASCAKSNGKQAPVLDQTLALFANGLVVSATSGTYQTFGGTYYLVLHSGDCQAAVKLLNKSTITLGKKMASDPAFNLAAQLVAAELNYAADAGKTPAATTAINEAVLLLGKYRFNGNTHTTISTSDAFRMIQLAGILDDYNNDR